jgi:dihydroflavonol-4-reductase
MTPATFLAAVLVPVLFAHACAPIEAPPPPPPPPTPPRRSRACVVVTGAAGFVAGHTIEALLQKGFAVHGVLPLPAPVLSAKNNAGAEDDEVAHLWVLEQQYAPSTGAKLELFRADPSSEYPYYEAALGCQALIHSAVVHPSAHTTSGTTVAAVLQSAARASIAQVILTLSVASLSPTTAKANQSDCTYDTHDVNDMATESTDALAIAHMQAEAAVEAWRKRQNIVRHRESQLDGGDAALPRVATVHFAEAWGPHQSKHATNVRREILDALSGKLPASYPIHYHTVDVRDVARAHVHIVESGRAQGRYSVSHSELSTVSMADVLYVVSLYPKLAQAFYMPLPLTLPVWVFSLIVPYHSSLRPAMVDAARRGPGCGYDGTRLVEEIGFVYKYDRVVDTIREYVASLLKVGVLEAYTAQVRRPSWHVYAAVLALLLPVVLTIVSFSAHSLVLCLCCRQKRRHGRRRGRRRGRGMDKSE